MSYRLAVAISVFGLVLNPVVGDASEWGGTEKIEDGIIHVHSPAAPVHERMVYEPEELWRIGGFSEAEEELFGVITDIIVDEQRNVYVLDAQLSEIRVFDIEGDYIRTIGREGEGPGEFRYPSDMLFLPDGQLGAIQQNRLVLFGTEGEPAGDFHFKEPGGGGFFRLVNVRPTGDQLAVLYQLGSKDKTAWSTTHRLGLFDMTGKQRIVIAEARTRMDYTGARFVEEDWNHFDQCWAASPDGRVLARSSSTEYEISVWDSDGKLDRVIHREYPPHRRSSEDIEGIRERWSRRFSWLPDLDFEIEESWAPVHDLYARADGTLWVRTSRGRRNGGEGTLAGFDVFDGNGRFDSEITLRGEFDPDNDGLFLVGDFLFVVTDLVSATAAAKGRFSEELTDDEEPVPMTVVCYRMRVGEIPSRTDQETRRSSP